MSAHEQFAEDLALYALGSLAGDERSALEAHLHECASCRRELQWLRGDLSLLSISAAGPHPPARARQRLLSAIGSETRKPAAQPGRPAVPWWRIIAWVVAPALFVFSLGLLLQNFTLRGNLTALRAQYGSQQAELEQTKRVMATLLDPEATKIELVAVGSKPQPRGKAIYQKRSRSLIFLASNLPPLPREKVYELWLIPTSGPPIAAGLFKPDARGSGTVVNPPLPEGVEAKTFAVTLEPESGSHDSPRGAFVIVGAGE
jgi:anti-sigma-K factor RskA